MILVAIPTTGSRLVTGYVSSKVGRLCPDHRDEMNDNADCYDSEYQLLRALFGGLFLIHVEISVPMDPLKCTRGRCGEPGSKR